MLSLSAAAILQKNSLTDTGAWLVLAELTLPDASVVRLARNTSDVTWDSQTWTAFPFVLEAEEEQGAGEGSILRCRLGNASNVMGAYLEAHDGLNGATVVLYVVHSSLVGTATAEVEQHYEVTAAKSTAAWVTLELGASNPFRRRFPRSRLLKNFCRWRYRSTECGYSGAALDAAAAVDKGSGKVGIPATGHGFVTGDEITIDGTDHYDATYTVDATTAADEIVVAATYTAETFAATDLAYYASCNKSLTNCRSVGNSERFGGFPGIGVGGIYL